ncbi:hypothetical protein AYI68_g4347, partial [Smittium mucronatum]
KSTIVDALSSDKRYTKFLHYLQRLHLIIPFNRLANVTVLAPTNEAFLKHEEKYKALYPNEFNAEALQYYGITKENMWLHVIRDGVYGSGSWVNGMVWESNSGWSPSSTPSKNVKILPISLPSQKNLSASERQGVMLKTRIDNRGRIFIGDVELQDGEIWCTSGVVQALDGVLSLPPKLIEYLKESPKVFSEIKFNDLNSPSSPSASFIPDSIQNSNLNYSLYIEGIKASGWDKKIFHLNNSASMVSDNKTAPSRHTLWAFDTANFISCFNPPQVSYLLFHDKINLNSDSKSLALQDTRSVMRPFISPNSISISRLGPGSHKVPVVTYNMKNGTELPYITVKVEKGFNSFYNGNQISSPDILAYDGIAHILSKSSCNNFKIQWNPKKLLLGMNATVFVNLVIQNGLESYIEDVSVGKKMTFLVPTNDAIAKFLEFGPYSLLTIRNWLLYHLVPSRILAQDLKSGMLLRTRYTSLSLGNAEQIIKVSALNGSFTFNEISVNDKDVYYLEDYFAAYSISTPLTPPQSLLVSIVQDLEYSLFIGMLKSSNLMDELVGLDAVSLILFSNSAVLKLGLAYKYIVSGGDSMDDLQKLIKYHFIKSLIYSDFKVPGSPRNIKKANTLLGNSLWFETIEPENRFIINTIDPFLSQPIQPLSFDSHNFSSSYVEISERDILFSNGVIHKVSSSSRILVPPEIIFSPKKLIKGIKSQCFNFLLENLNLTYLLGSSVKNQSTGLSKTLTGDHDVLGYSFLVPGDDAWMNLSGYREFHRRVTNSNFTLPLPQILNDSIKNPWSDKSDAELSSYLKRLVLLHVLPIKAKPEKAKKPKSSDRFGVDIQVFDTLLETVQIEMASVGSRIAFQLAGSSNFADDPSIPNFYSNQYTLVVDKGNISPSFYGITNNTMGSLQFKVYEMDSILFAPPILGKDVKWYNRFKNALLNGFLGILGTGFFGMFLYISYSWIRKVFIVGSQYEEL